jgi:hypothetical protein
LARHQRGACCVRASARDATRRRKLAKRVAARDTRAACGSAETQGLRGGSFLLSRARVGTRFHERAFQGAHLPPQQQAALAAASRRQKRAA